MDLTLPSYRQILKWVGEINEKTGNPETFVSKIAFAQAYIKNSFEFVVKNFNIDYATENYLESRRDILSQEEFAKKINSRVNLEKFIQKKIGICKQFSSLLCILTATDRSNLQKIGLPLAPAFLVCTILREDGKKVQHQINSYVLKGKRFFCDPTFQKGFHNQNFFLQSQQALQKRYANTSQGRIVGSADLCEIKERDFVKVCKIINTQKFYRNTETESYKSSTLTF